MGRSDRVDDVLTWGGRCRPPLAHVTTPLMRQVLADGRRRSRRWRAGRWRAGLTHPAGSGDPAGG